MALYATLNQGRALVGRTHSPTPLNDTTNTRARAEVATPNVGPHHRKEEFPFGKYSMPCHSILRRAQVNYSNYFGTCHL